MENEVSYIETLLSELKLSDYTKIFTDNGFNNKEDVLQIDVDILKKLDIKAGHRYTILQKIKEANDRNKQEKEEAKFFEQSQEPIQILVLGSRSAGKSALVKYFHNDRYDPNSIITKGKEESERKIFTRDTSLTVKIRDIGGQPKYFDQIENKDFEDAVATLAVCSLDDEHSLKELEKYYLAKLRALNKCKIIIVCNKFDLKNKYEKNYEIIKNDYKRINSNNGSLLKFYFVSAFSGYNVTNIFDELINTAIRDQTYKRTINVNDQKQITERCEELCQGVGKIVAFWIENNAFQQIGYKGTCRSDTYPKYVVNCCYFEGNTWFVDKFNRTCQALWQCINFENRDQAVKYMYDNLTSQDWCPLVFAFDVNQEYKYKGKYSRMWEGKNSKIKIFAFC